MSNQHTQHVWQQQTMLLQALIDSKQFNMNPHRFTDLSMIYYDGFKMGIKTPLRTAEIKRMGPSVTIDTEKGPFQHTPFTKEQLYYIQHGLPKKLEVVSSDLWQSFIKKEESMDELNQLFFGKYQVVDAERLVNVYFEGLSKGVFLGLLIIHQEHSAFIHSELDRYIQSFEDDLDSNTESMNDLFQQLTKRIQESK